MEFFELYGKYFNYSETGISLRHGGTYFSKARRGWIDPRKRHLLSIEDPGDISEFLRNIDLQPKISVDPRKELLQVDLSFPYYKVHL